MLRRFTRFRFTLKFMEKTDTHFNSGRNSLDHPPKVQTDPIQSLFIKHKYMPHLLFEGDDKVKSSKTHKHRRNLTQNKASEIRISEAFRKLLQQRTPVVGEELKVVEDFLRIENRMFYFKKLSFSDVHRWFLRNLAVVLEMLIRLGFIWSLLENIMFMIDALKVEHYSTVDITYVYIGRCIIWKCIIFGSQYIHIY